jgi:hypothetical protein
MSLLQAYLIILPPVALFTIAFVHSIFEFFLINPPRNISPRKWLVELLKAIFVSPIVYSVIFLCVAIFYYPIRFFGFLVALYKNEWQND